MIILFLENITFQNPEAFALLLLVPALGFWYFLRRKDRYVRLKLSSLQSMEGMTSWRGRLRTMLPLLRALAFISLVAALARPQEVLKEEEVNAEAIDILMVMDLSSSMLAQDFRPDRLEVSKRVASEFVDKREYDRIGLVIFAGEAFTKSALTTDHRELKRSLAELECGILQDGTAIGDGLATAINRLKESEVKSKIVILLTDGDNNAGYVNPMMASQIAREFDVKVYTIGVGSRGKATAPVSRSADGRYIFGLATVKIDEELLRKISEETGGKYFRATNAQSLAQIYAEIDRLEKTKIEVTTIKRYSEEFYRFALLGIIFLLLELLLRYTVLRTVP